MGDVHGLSEVMVVAALHTELLFVRGPKAALGMGERAAEGLWRALAPRTPKGVILGGYCGALRPELRPGTLILADRLEGPEDAVPVEATVLSRAQALLPGAKIGALFTHPRLWPKDELLRGTPGIPSARGCLAVDMESWFVARGLSQRGIPFLVARVVLDPLEEEVSLGWSRFRWAPRALWCSWLLGRAAPQLRRALVSEESG